MADRRELVFMEQRTRGAGLSRSRGGERFWGYDDDDDDHEGSPVPGLVGSWRSSHDHGSVAAAASTTSNLTVGTKNNCDVGRSRQEERPLVNDFGPFSGSYHYSHFLNQTRTLWSDRRGPGPSGGLGPEAHVGELLLPRGTFQGASKSSWVLGPESRNSVDLGNHLETGTPSTDHQERRFRSSFERSRTNNPRHTRPPCVLCLQNGSANQTCMEHALKDASGRVTSPILRVYTCPTCDATGDFAHTENYCPARQHMGKSCTPYRWYTSSGHHR